MPTEDGEKKERWCHTSAKRKCVSAFYALGAGGDRRIAITRIVTTQLGGNLGQKLLKKMHGHKVTNIKRKCSVLLYTTGLK